ncbi:hypothetical protein BD408DRAFT_448870 [Parasitella parasitica]|nr:hypothetical protein BD408DRAFT_448870 [Parasitella parasitica]
MLKKTTSISSTIKTATENNQPPTTTADSSHKPAPAITSSSRLTLRSPKAALKSRPTKLPVASKKRRFFTLKATTVPCRPEAHNDLSQYQSIICYRHGYFTHLICHYTITDGSSLPAPPTDLRLPRSEDLHSFELMPNWIQDIYSKLSMHEHHLKSHTAQIDQIHGLLQRNQELQLALDIANRRIAELEASTQTAALPASNNTTTTPILVAPLQPGGTACCIHRIPWLPLFQLSCHGNRS